MSNNFARIIVADFEYEVRDGELPQVLCLVAYVLDENLQHIDTIRKWRGDFDTRPPFDVGPDTLFVAYSAWAEMECFLSLGWKFPTHIFDLHTAIWRRRTFCTHRRTICTRSHASGCPMRARRTGWKVGSGWRKPSSRETSAKDVGAT